MAIDSRDKRNAALIDNWAVLFPDGSILPTDKQILLGQYPIEVTYDDTDSISINFYAERARSLNLYTEQSRSINLYAERTRSVNFER